MKPRFQELERQKQKRSVIWLYFSILSDAKAKCNLCRSIYSHKNGNITNLRKHLKTRHPTLMLDEPKEKILPVEVAPQNITLPGMFLVCCFILNVNIIILPVNNYSNK